MSVLSRDIDMGVFTCNRAYGSSSGGCDYGLIGNKEICIQEITWYPRGSGIGRVMLKKHDQTCLTVGEMHSDLSQPGVTWTFKPDERLKTIEMFSQNNCLAGVRVTTCEPYEQRLEVGQVSGNPVEVPVGTGRWVGIFGNSGQYVDNLGFAMRR